MSESRRIFIVGLSLGSGQRSNRLDAVGGFIHPRYDRAALAGQNFKVVFDIATVARLLEVSTRSAKIADIPKTPWGMASRRLITAAVCSALRAILACGPDSTAFRARRVPDRWWHIRPLAVCSNSEIRLSKTVLTFDTTGKNGIGVSGIAL